MSDAANERKENAKRLQELAAAHAAHESVAAQKLIDEFLVKAKEQGLAPVPLKAKLLNGRLVKTDKQGWYIKRNKSVAIGTDGGYYILTIQGSLSDRLFGAKLKASPPQLVVSRGGRDGEAGDLEEFLTKTLNQTLDES